MISREISISVSELTQLSIVCTCGAAVTLDVLKSLPNPLGRVKRCPVCADDYSSQMIEEVDEFIRALKKARSVNYKLAFRVSDPASDKAERPIDSSKNADQNQA